MKVANLFITTVVAGLCYSGAVSAEDAPMEDAKLAAEAAVEVQGEKSYEVTLEFVDTKIQDVLSILAEQRPNTSILVGPGVQGKVTLNLKKVAWLKALELILEQHGLEYVKASDNIFQIKVGKVAEAVAEKDVTIQLYEMSEIVNMDAKELFKLYTKLPDAREDVTTEEMREFIIENNKIFVKRIQADNQQAIKVIKALTKSADLNFSFAGVAPTKVVKGQSPEVVQSPYENKITLSLRRLPLERVLAMVCGKGGLSCLYKDDVWEVSPRQPEKERPLVIGHFEVKFVAIDKELLDVLSSVISSRGKITAGKNKTLVVKATDEELESVRNTLAVMDKPTPQVMVEARFFELADGESSYVGIDWGAALGQEGTKITTTPFDRKYKETEIKETSDPLKNYSSTWEKNPWAVDGSTDPNDYFLNETGDWIGEATSIEQITTAALGVAEFSAVVHALKADDGSQQLANPKIIVTSGEQATIHIGEKEPIFKATSSGSGESAERTYELDNNYGKNSSKVANLTGDQSDVQDVFNAQGTPGYLDLGTLLTVAPTVKTEDQVYIKVIPNLTKKIGTKTAGDGTSYPVLLSTKVYTEFTINSGQTIAIGGLVKEEELNESNKIPLLGDIPLIGKYLFSYESKENKRSETVIFLTVNVVGAKDLKTTSGVPVTSKLVDPVLDMIRQQDAKGAEYVSPNKSVVERVVIDPLAGKKTVVQEKATVETEPVAVEETVEEDVIVIE